MPDTTTGKVPIIACVRSAWAFLLQNWRLFLSAAVICAVIAQIGIAASLMFGGSAGREGILPSIPAVLAGLMFNATVLRKAVRDEYVPPVGLTLGPDEARLFGVGVSFALLMIPIVFIGGIILTATVFSRVAATPEAMEAMAENPEAMMKAIEAGIGSTGIVVLESVMTLIFCLVLGFVAYIQAATIGEKRIIIFGALRWMGGNLLRVLSAIVLTVLPTLLIMLAVGATLLPLAGNLPVYLVVSAVISAIDNFVAIPVAALGAVFYKGLRPPDYVEK